MSKLLLIDGNAILHRAFHALPPLTTRRGDPINAVYGLVSITLKIIQDLVPTHIAVAFDEKAPTFRHKEFANYQAHRRATPEELSNQFEKAKEFLVAANIPIYSMPGYEADDLIGTLASQATSYKLPATVVIVTGDRDQLQLVNDKVKVYMPLAGLSGTRLMGEAEVVEKIGVPPGKIVDYKALAGDPSDNYPGVAGIGPKGAINLLTEYRDLDDIYYHLQSIPPATKEKLINYKEDALLSKKLATIVKDVPINFTIDKAGKWDIDSREVLEVFDEFGFKTLTERVKKVGKEIDESKQMSLI